MHSQHTLVKCDHSANRSLSCRFMGRMFTARESRHKQGRFLFGWSDPRTGQHVRIRCSGPDQFTRCLRAAHSAGWVQLRLGGAS